MNLKDIEKVYCKIIHKSNIYLNKIVRIKFLKNKFNKKVFFLSLFIQIIIQKIKKL